MSYEELLKLLFDRMDELSVNRSELCRKVGITPSYLSRLQKDVYGKKVSGGASYVVLCRMAVSLGLVISVSIKD